MTPDLQLLITPTERADAVERLEAVIDARLQALVAAYELRWAGLPPSVRDWLREMLDFTILDLRREALAIVRDLLPPSRVH